MYNCSVIFIQLSGTVKSVLTRSITHYHSNRERERERTEYMFFLSLSSFSSHYNFLSFQSFLFSACCIAPFERKLKTQTRCTDYNEFKEKERVRHVAQEKCHLLFISVFQIPS